MTSESFGPMDAETLRQRALQRMKQRRGDLSFLDTEDVKALVQQLEIHQAELEVQNEELRQTQLRLAQAHDRYLDLFEFAPVGYLTLDKKGVVRQANLACTMFCGRSRPDLEGRRLEELIEREDREAVYLMLRKALVEKTNRQADVRMQVDSERPVWAKLDVAYAPADEAMSEGFCVTLTDISERKQAEQELESKSRDLEALAATLEKRVEWRTEQLQIKAQQLRRLMASLCEVEQRQRQEFAQLLHDDLQQILVGARYQLNAAASRCQCGSRETLAVARDLIGEAAEKARSLSHELGPASLQNGLGVALRNLVEKMRRNHGLEVTLEGDQMDDGLAVEMRAVLYRAVRELLLNVVKHAGVGKATLSVAVDEQSVTVVVQDGGRGFDPRSLEGPGGPEGLGLLAARERLDALGGRFEIVSAPGEGCRAVVSVPYVRDRKADEAAPVGPAVKKDDLRGPARVLLVDDHPVVRQGLAMVLEEEEDVEVVGEAGDGLQALEMVEMTQPDVVLMDLNMPGMAGDETTRQIKRRFRGVKVIALSMHNEAEGADRMLGAGADVYLAKAGPSDEIIRAIRLLVGRPAG